MNDHLVHMGNHIWVHTITGETITKHPDHPRMQLMHEYISLPQISKEYETPSQYPNCNPKRLLVIAA